MIIGLIALVGVSTVLDFVHDQFYLAGETQTQSRITDLHALQTALIDSETGVRGYVLTQRPEYLAPYQSGIGILAGVGRPALEGLDDFSLRRADATGTPTPASATLADLRTAWDSAIRLTAENQPTQATATLLSAQAKDLMDRLRNSIAGYLRQLAAEEEAESLWSERLGFALQIINLCSVLIAVAAMIYAFGRITRAIAAGFAAKEQTDRLFSMADMLQSAAGQDDTNEVLRAAAAALLAGFSGTLYVFNNSRDRLDLSTRWGSLAAKSVDHLPPAGCWALKRGKPHINTTSDDALRCSHVADGLVTLEIPMAARGELYGLLEIGTEGADSVARLTAIQPIAMAMADAMSLALSSLALRERLRNQALRDALTGLYNRRFLEEMLERMCTDAERRKTSIAAIMIDLDHFKKLNDQHGHGAGDAVLRDVASAVLSCIRSVDVACRYGGEELAILLPDCTLATATGKAEQIRAKIAELTRAGGISVTGSLGVAAIPETSAAPGDLLAAADAALYQAKQQGRDRVAVAPARGGAAKLSLVDNSSVSAPAE